MKACEEMTDNKLFTLKYVKQARTRASKMSAFVLLHGPSASLAANNQERVLLHCHFAVTMHRAVEHCRVDEKKRCQKGLEIFVSLSTKNTFLSPPKRSNRRSSGSTHAAVASCPQPGCGYSSRGKAFLSNVVLLLQDTDKGSVMQQQVFR